MVLELGGSNIHPPTDRTGFRGNETCNNGRGRVDESKEARNGRRRKEWKKTQGRRKAAARHKTAVRSAPVPPCSCFCGPFPVLYCPVLRCPVPSRSCFCGPLLSCPVLSCPVLSCPVSSGSGLYRSVSSVLQVPFCSTGPVASGQFLRLAGWQSAGARAGRLVDWLADWLAGWLTGSPAG